MFIFVVEVFLELDHVVCLVDHHDQVEAEVPGEDSLWRRLQFVPGLEDGPTRPLGGTGAKPRLYLVTRLCVGLPPENSKYRSGLFRGYVPQTYTRISSDTPSSPRWREAACQYGPATCSPNSAADP